MSAPAHRLIARRDLPGYHPQSWCAVCGKATSRNAAFVSCEDDSCQNLCHTSCLGDTPVYRCDYTEQLRAQAGIPDPVTHLSEGPATPSPLLPDEQEKEANHWEDLEKAELISLVEKLTEEAFRSNIIIKAHQQDRDLIIQNREVFASALKIADKLIASKQRESTLTTRTQAVSALSDTIDEHWEEVCHGFEYWKAWWSSDRPRELRYTAKPAAHPVHPRDPPPLPLPPLPSPLGRTLHPPLQIRLLQQVPTLPLLTVTLRSPAPREQISRPDRTGVLTHSHQLNHPFFPQLARPPAATVGVGEPDQRREKRAKAKGPYHRKQLAITGATRATRAPPNDPVRLR